MERVAQKFGHTFHYYDIIGGVAGLEAYGDALRPQDYELGRSCDSILFGSVGDPRKYTFTGANGTKKYPSRKEAAVKALASFRRGMELFANPYPAAGPVRCLRTSLVDWDSRNPEVLLAETRSEGSYGIQNKSLPFVTDGWAWNGVGPTWTMLNRFYTKNGLPWDEDPEYKDKDKLKIVNVDASHADEAHEGSKTLLFNLDREPRFYAWVAFQGGYYEVMNGSTNPAYVMSNGKKDNSDSRLICDFVLGGNCSRGTATVQRPGNYTPSGYLNKKGVDPNTVVSTNATKLNQYPWPIIRLADLYLAYAEACVETNDLETAKQYLNKVRERAGIPTVETAWSGVAALDQTKLRQIVRQERMNELYLENQNFWDMRRWLLAGQYFNVKAKGLNIAATTIEDYAIVKTIDFERKFEAPTQYLLPIPSADINRNEKLVNNPGY